MKNVLIADCDTTLIQGLMAALKREYNISSLPMEEASSFLTCGDVDAILLPFLVDADEIYKVCEKVLSYRDRKVPVILLLIQGDAGWEQRLLGSGADEVITLPTADELVIHRINRSIELNTLKKDRAYVDTYLDAVSLSFAELVECRDETTGGHLKNTVRYFKILLEELISRGYNKEVISEADVRDLLRSAALHDIGKLGINDEILRKSSFLDNQEYEYMKTHTVLGKEAFEKIIHETGGTRWLYLARDIAYCHHERWDGKGYPNGLKGEEIPFYARMMTIADVYDALTSRRSYKEAYSHQRAVEIILEDRGKLFDPDLVDLFIEAKDRFEEALHSRKCNTED